MWLDKLLDSRLSKIAAIASLISFVINLPNWLNVTILAPYIPEDYVSIVLGLSLSILLTIYLIRGIRYIHTIRRMPEDINYLSKTINEVQLKLVSCLKEGNISRNTEKLHDGLKNVCNVLQSNFAKYTRDECGVCIKILRLDSGGDSSRPVVHTLTRDANSSRTRASVDRNLKFYEYYRNSAFNDIISADRPYCFYISNDLLRLSKKHLYNNANPDWHRYYNACIVVPIAATDNPGLEDATGFLCIDNKIGGFNAWMHARILSSIATNIYEILILNDIVASATSSPDRAEANQAEAEQPESRDQE